MPNIHNKVKSIFNNKESKTVASNIGYLSLLQVASYTFPLITLPYLARTIGVESFGKIAFASAVIVWFQTIADWGFNYTATRDVAKNRDDIDKVSEIFSNVLWARVLLALLSFIVLFAAILLIPQFQTNADVLLVTFLLVPGHIMFPDWFFQALEKMRYITIFNLVSKSLFTIAVFLFIKERSDFILQPFFTSLGFLLSGIGSMYIILYRWNIRLRKPSIKHIIKTIRGSTDVFINNIMPNLYNSFSVLLLGFYGGSVANGKLDAGGKFVAVAQQFMGVLSRSFFPFLSRRIDQHNLYVKINLYIAAFFSVTLILCAPFIIKIFFTPEFYDAILVTRIMAVSVFFISLSNIYGTNYMIIQGYERKLRNITFVISLVGFGLSFPLIYHFSFVGAAVNIALTRGILGVSIMCAAINIKNKLI